MTPAMLRSLILTPFVGMALLALGQGAEAQPTQCRYLEMRLMQLRAGGHDGPEMDAVKAVLAANDCPGFHHPVGPAGPAHSGPGTIRTVCVRACDGYYFPISFSTTPDHLQDDAATCQQRCPGGDAKLYYYRLGDGPESMHSIDGAAYTDLPTAFSYRTTLDKSCTCGTPTVVANPLGPPASAPLSAPGTYVSLQAPAGEAPTAPRPQPRAEPGVDPETLMNRDGGLRLAAQDQEKHAPNAAGSVRVILPGWNTALSSSVMLTPVPN